MGKRLFQLNGVGQVNKDDYLLVDGEGYLESKKVKLKNIGLEKFNTEKFYNKDDVDYNFVAKEPNKGLSTNDFTNEYKNKLDASGESDIQNRILSYITYQSLGNEIEITSCRPDIEGDHIIPELIGGLPVTTIGEQAFYKCINLTGLIIPNTVKEIRTAAFAECINLKNVILSENLEGYINGGAFIGCYSLESIKIPSNIEHIGNQAFSSSGLKNITFEGKINTIGDEAFREANSITSISLPITLTSIGAKAFYDLGSLTDVYYEGSEDQWKEISIGSDNDSLFSEATTIHYNQRLATVDYVDSKGKAVAEALESKADNSDVLKKQNTLVSGENIKTINGESILGSGNITIEGGSGGAGSGIYIGSGEMPEGYNVQLDPSGDTLQVDKELDENSNNLIENQAVAKVINEVKNSIGTIDIALDEIIEIQEQLIADGNLPNGDEVQY